MKATERDLTFLFTDVEGSTRLWEQEPELMSVAMARHDEVMDGTVRNERGRIVKSMGDGVLAVFESPLHGVAAAVAAQRALDELDAGVTLRVRMGVHCGPASERDGDYFGPTLNRAARLMGLGHGGQVLVSDAVAVLVRDHVPPTMTLRDLGEHRLRDLTNVERVHQVDDGALGTTFPPLQSLDAYSTNLPFQPTSFVGRTDDVDRLIPLVRERRLVTLTGVGGVGKTRLALRVAAELLPELRDGVVVCELASAESSETVDEVVAQALAIGARPGLSLHDSIIESLRGRTGLVVLDNCEHVLDASAALAADILRDCPQLRLLATSREGLALDGEQLYAVRSLEVPESRSTLAANESDATMLFAERARAIEPSFVLDDENVADVVEICRRLDGIPLAIELAAARTASMRPAEIAGLLDERFRLLGGGRRRSVERHQTLRTAVDWSYSLLDDRTRDLFARLGVFTGSFDAAAGLAVAGDEADRFEVLDLLEELVAKSMLATDVSNAGSTRYQLLETFRQYALERLAESGSTDELRLRHAQHFAFVTAGLGPRILGPDEVAARRALEADLGNLRAAVDWAIEAGDGELVASLLSPIAQEAGWNRSSGVGAWCRRALVLAPERPTADWDWLRIAATFHSYAWAGDWIDVARTVTEFIDRAECDGEVRAWSYAMRGFTSIVEGMEASVAVMQVGAEAVADQNGPQTLSLISALAMFAELAGDHEEALRRADEAMGRAAALRFPSGTALAYLARGVTRTESEPDVARSDLEAALSLAGEGAAEIVADHALRALGSLEWREGRWRSSAGTTATALERSARIGDYSASAQSLALAASVLGDAGHLVNALAVDVALNVPELFGTFGYALDTPEDRERLQVVAAARQHLDAATIEQIEASTRAMTRDEFLRSLVDDLKEVAETAD
jgi:predicted ATPase